MIEDGSSFYEKELKGMNGLQMSLFTLPRQLSSDLSRNSTNLDEENFNSCFGLLSQSLCPFLTETSTSKVLGTRDYRISD